MNIKILVLELLKKKSKITMSFFATSAPGLIFSRFFENLTTALFLRFWITGPINVPFTTLDSREPPLAAPSV